MSFTFRLCVTYGILFVGIQVVHFGMRSNGGASPMNPVWRFIEWIHWILTYGTLYALGAAVLVTAVTPLVFSLTPEKKIEESKKVESPPPAFASEEVLESDEHQKNEEKELHAKARELEELKKEQIIEKRRNRSAEDAARSALDDFL